MEMLFILSVVISILLCTTTLSTGVYLDSHLNSVSLRDDNDRGEEQHRLPHNTTDVITLHADDDLNVRSDKIEVYSLSKYDNTADKLVIERISREDNDDLYNIKLQSPLKANHYYELVFGQFSSSVDDEASGLFVMKYTEYGTQKYLASTRMQPIYARRVFPCWDEPDFKAQFQINILHHKDFNSLSNMPLESTEVVNNTWHLDRYQMSGNMSTHSLAIVVSQLSPLHRKDSKGRNFTVWARREKLNFTNYALNVTKELIGYFEDYLGIPYPLQKFDIIAMPRCGSENGGTFGLLTYSECDILWDPESDPVSLQVWVTGVVSRQLAHQWFGNIVTMKWWDSWWVNEGLSTLFQYIGMDHIYSTWNKDEAFQLYVTQRALNADSTVTSIPLDHPVLSKNEIEDTVYSTTYNKAASLLRMVQSFVGQNAFQNGIKNYLHENQFGNADADDLWRRLTEAAVKAGKDVNTKSVMDTWTRQTNYPLLIINRSGDNVFNFKQIHYFKSSDVNPPSSPYGYIWQIPLTYESANRNTLDDTEVIWMPNRTITKMLNIKSSDCYIFNKQQVGYYRVHYADNNWQLLIKQLSDNFQTIPVYSRLQILDDLFNLANNDVVPYTDFLNATKYLKRENSYAVWETVKHAFSFFYRMFALNDGYADYQAYQQALLDESLKSIDWTTMKEGGDVEKNLLRGYLVQLACQVELQSCVTSARTLYTKWMRAPDKNPIPRSLRASIYCLAVRSGGLKEWHFLTTQLLANGTDEVEDYNMLYGLSCSNNTNIIRGYMDWIVHHQDFWYALPLLAGSPAGNNLLWQYAIDGWKNITDEGNTGSEERTRRLITRLLHILSDQDASLTNIAKQEEIIKLRDNYVISGRDSSFVTKLGEYFKVFEQTIDWMNIYGHVIRQWLKENFKRNKA
ncbi:unnamed protein product [Heterobilharzia americana]|nr:unnamed protein product [Heterobilharzia americana]